MRMSCNGCRVLRKGCSENCSIRPCLQWIKNPEAQANATVFLAKSYGRAGLMNLINAGPEHLRPAIFRSLLYEACGRIVNPIYGSVGLLWSGNWQLCQGAVEAVLKGAPIVSMPSDTAVGGTSPPMKAYDIRHVTKDDHVTQEVHNIKTRCRFKRVGKPKPKVVSQAGFFAESADHNPTSSPVCNLQWSRASPNDSSQAASHDSSTTHDSVAHAAVDGDSRETESMFSVETVEASLVRGAQPHCQEDSDVELELTLGFEPVHGDRSHTSQSPVSKPRIEIEGSEDDACMFHLGLEISA